MIKPDTPFVPPVPSEPETNPDWFYLEAHTLANLFPMAEDDDLQSIIKDVRANGFRSGYIITMYEGKVLDGRNRLEACKRVWNEGYPVKPEFYKWDTDQDGDPLAFVLRENLHRRHLTASQKAAIAADLEHLYAEPAHERQVAALKQNAATVPSNDGRNGGEGGEAIEKAAADVGVSTSYAKEAKALKRTDPETFEKVKTGEITIPKAKKVIEQKQPKNTDHEKAMRAIERRASKDADRLARMELVQDAKTELARQQKANFVEHGHTNAEDWIAITTANEACDFIDETTGGVKRFEEKFPDMTYRDLAVIMVLQYAKEWHRYQCLLKQHNAILPIAFDPRQPAHKEATKKLEQIDAEMTEYADFEKNLVIATECYIVLENVEDVEDVEEE